MKKRIWRKGLVLGIIVLFVGASIVPSTGNIIFENYSQIDFVYVDDNFNSSTPGWGYDHFDNIQDGIDAVSESGRVYVFFGTYYENVVVNKTIILTVPCGQSYIKDENAAIIDGGSENVINITADWVNISGFTIRNGWKGIYICSNYNTIRRNNISKNHDGIYIQGNSNTITDNIIILINRSGIILVGSQNTITGNNISNNGDGIYLTGRDSWPPSYIPSIKNTIIKNNFRDNDRDAYFEKSFLNRWRQNYWNRPLIFPKLILGQCKLIIGGMISGVITIPWFNIDWRPAKEPYDIGM